jgi:hypothetical protein
MEQSLALSRQFDRIMGLVRIGSIAQGTGAVGRSSTHWHSPTSQILRLVQLKSHRQPQQIECCSMNNYYAIDGKRMTFQSRD